MWAVGQASWQRAGGAKALSVLSVAGIDGDGDKPLWR